MRYDIESIKKRKEKTKTISKIFNVILIILIYNIVVLAVFGISKMKNIDIFGYKAYIIVTNSMEPNIKIGDVVITKKVEQNELTKGDVITFKRGEEVITHRITKIDQKEEGNEYTTRGDNNNIEDKEKVKYDMIEGKKIITIPYLGNIVRLLENRILFLIIILVLLILCFFKIQKKEKKDIRREKKKIEDEKKDEDKIYREY